MGWPLRVTLLAVMLCIAAQFAVARAATVGSKSARDAQALDAVLRLRDTAPAIIAVTAEKTRTLAAFDRNLRAEIDFLTITKSVPGPFWTVADPDENSDAVELTANILAHATVADFEKTRNLPYEIKQILHLADGDLVVTHFTEAGRRNVEFDWRMRPAATELNAVDVSVDANSMVARYREDAHNTFRSLNGSVRDFIINLRERPSAVALD